MIKLENEIKELKEKINALENQLNDLQERFDNVGEIVAQHRINHLKNTKYTLH